MSVSRTINQGTSWLRYNITSGTGYTYSIAVCPGNSSIVYAAGCEGTAAALYKTTNNGTSWFSSSSGITGDTIHKISMHPTNPNILYAANGNGIFKSTNAGLNWIYKGCSSARAVLVDRDDGNIIYAGTSSGVFKSTNGGDTWTVMNTGLRDIRINTLGLYPGSYLFASTEGDGIYRHPIEPSAIEENRDEKQTVLSIYPNPAVYSARINFLTLRPGHVELTVYDSQGRSIKNLIDECRSAGAHTIAWDGTDVHNRKVSAGIYILNLRTECLTENRTLVIINK